jgi:hypothetical protein
MERAYRYPETDQRRVLFQQYILSSQVYGLAWDFSATFRVEYIPWPIFRRIRSPVADPHSCAPVAAGSILTCRLGKINFQAISGPAPSTGDTDVDRAS